MKHEPALFRAKTIRGKLTVLRDEDGAYWYKAIEAARSLGYGNPFNAVRHHCHEAMSFYVPTDGGVQAAKFINTHDLYLLAEHAHVPMTKVHSDEYRGMKFLNSIQIEEVICVGNKNKDMEEYEDPCDDCDDDTDDCNDGEEDDSEATEDNHENNVISGLSYDDLVAIKAMSEGIIAYLDIKKKYPNL